MADVADQIRLLLKQDGRPNAVMARLARMHPVNLRQFRSGMRSLPLKKLEILARILGAQIVVATRATTK